MQLENYLNFLQQTAESYSNKVKEYLIRQFIDMKIATRKAGESSQLQLSKKEILDISNRPLTEQFSKCIQESEEARKFLEKWEFIKDYKYSVLFTCNDFDTALKKIKGIQPINDNYENEHIEKYFTNPVLYYQDDNYFLKFNLSLSAYNPSTREELLCKYPFLVVFHKSIELIEFRFDGIKRLFILDGNESTIYSDLISNMQEYLNDNFDLNLIALDLNFMIEVGKKGNDVKLIAQYMQMVNGGNAQLAVGHNQEYVLPFVGELKSLLDDHHDELEKVPSFKEALDQFMYEKEEMSEYPWIELLWENEVQTRNIHVKLIFNYRNNHYCLIQHYTSNVLIGMERINHVVEYISNHKGDSATPTK